MNPLFCRRMIEQRSRDRDPVVVRTIIFKRGWIIGNMTQGKHMDCLRHRRRLNLDLRMIATIAEELSRSWNIRRRINTAIGLLSKTHILNTSIVTDIKIKLYHITKSTSRFNNARISPATHHSTPLDLKVHHHQIPSPSVGLYYSTASPNDRRPTHLTEPSIHHTQPTHPSSTPHPPEHLTLKRAPTPAVVAVPPAPAHSQRDPHNVNSRALKHSSKNTESKSRLY